MLPQGLDVDHLDLFVGRTIGDITPEDIVEMLRAMPNNGEVDIGVAYIERVVGHVPPGVMCTLAKARAGESFSGADPDAERLRASATRLTPALTPLLLRHAVCGLLAAMVRDEVSESQASPRFS